MSKNPSPYEAPATFLLFLLVCIQVIGMTYISPTGGVSPDSMNYLRLASILSEEWTLFVPDLFSPTQQSFFAVWPAAYPALISLPARLIPFELSPAAFILLSKAVNITFILATILLLKKYIPRHGLLYGCFFLADPIIRVTYVTWSEVPFFFGMVALSLSLHRFYHQPHWRWACAILLSSLFLFTTRYIGLFALMPIGLVGALLLYRRRYAACITLAIPALLTSIFAAFYLYINYTHTGRLTGILRRPSEESSTELLSTFFTHTGEQLAFFLIPLALVALYGILETYIKKPSAPTATQAPNTLWAFFLLVGGSYLLATIVLRWHYRFDTFDYRLFAPATLLCAMAILNLALQKNIRLAHITRYLVLMVILSLIYHLPPYAFTRGTMPFIAERQAIESRAAPVPENSVVVFLDLYNMHYAPHIQNHLPFPYFGPLHMPESAKNNLSAYLAHLCATTHAQHIYVDIPGAKAVQKRRPDRVAILGEAFAQRLSTQGEKDILHLKTCDKNPNPV